ncbi:alpha/beta hydrolase [Skermania sp. ID1734]|uniref:alpha/beta fold hydrolase n=1 Tax=Skermania sp. ID1734 TaxID=2597516 RepID=UPI00117C964E|nr:alpha/beta hydrolase [Skermania sp. ID1734]TSD95613.1 alpha/beta hydrolase [Skermania sp. ID1734]
MFTTQNANGPSTTVHSTVVTPDGVRLAVREEGDLSADLTVLLLHGHCLRSESWAYVRDQIDPNLSVRVVSYDHRGHGDSEEAPASTYTIGQLADDLHAVIDAVAPTGPVMLVGHSMGGMTAITYAGRYPAEIGTRIVGMGLVATAASNLSDAGFGRLLRNPATGWFQAAVRRAPGLMRRVKHLGCRALAPVIETAEFGNRKVSPRIVALAAAMHNQTPITTMATFLSSFRTFDETDSLGVLAEIPTLVLCGTADLMTPLTHSVTIAAQVRGAELVCVDGAGHSVILEQPAAVAHGIARLISRARAASGDTAHDASGDSVGARVVLAA